jgi:hypothetical protein
MWHSTQDSCRIPSPQDFGTGRGRTENRQDALDCRPSTPTLCSFKMRAAAQRELQQSLARVVTTVKIK